MEQLKAIYEDPSQSGSFGGLEALYTEAKSYTLHKPARKKFKRNKTLVFLQRRAMANGSLRYVTVERI